MTRKEQQITELYVNELLEIAKDEKSWVSFLNRASYHYKYRFDEQVLIYAQRPDATACAETTIWNKKLKRWINKGSKGIALITEEDGEMGLRFVFDVADTNSRVYNKDLKLWTAKKEYIPNIIEALEDTFGEIENKKEDLGKIIISVVTKNIEENVQDYFENMKSELGNSELSKLDDESIKAIFEAMLMSSATALVMSRCGLDPLEYIDESNFQFIKYFNTFETISVLGTATRDFSKEILLEISKTIINVQKKEKNINRTFEKDKENNYDKENEKGSVENEYNLHNERGLSNTRLDITRENKQERATREIRNNEVTISKNEQEGNLHNTSNEERIDQTLDSNTRNSSQENTTNSRTNEETIWNNRRNESQRPNGMDRTDEQYSINSRTNGNKGDNLQLKEQTQKEAENASFFDDETIKNILDNAPNVAKDKVEFGGFIYENYEDKEKCKAYIKEILGTAYTEFEWNNQRIGYKANKDTLNIWKGNYLNRTEECFKNWDSITEYCIANHVHYYTPQYNKESYTFIVGDVIYLDLQPFTISDINDENLTIYDNDFPLDSRVVAIEDIIYKVAPNPMNDYLKNRKIPKVEESSFDKWLDTFIEEKEIDLQQVIEIKTENNTHYFEIGNIVENIKRTTQDERNSIKEMIVKIDFNNGDIVDYFRHLAQALANNFDKEIEEQENKQKEQLSKKFIKKNINIEYFDLHPEIKIEDRNNFKIKNDELGVGTAKEKYNNNINAIKVLKLCEEQNRYATKEEQEILSKYVGWGGLKSVFEENNDNWRNEYAELKNSLTEDEYKNARESSLTAYYTPPVVIKNIYKALQNMGLKQANILEPSCRSWQFYGNVARRIK